MRRSSSISASAGSGSSWPCARPVVARGPLHAWSDPLTIVLVGCSLATLAPVLADLTHGDPGRSHLVLTFGTSLCALVMGADALVRLLRGQHARSSRRRSTVRLADQALAAERAARSELDHDLTGALMAVEGAARALERRERRLHRATSTRSRRRSHPRSPASSSCSVGYGTMTRAVGSGSQRPSSRSSPATSRRAWTSGPRCPADSLRRARPSRRPRSSATCSTTPNATRQGPRCASRPQGGPPGSCIRVEDGGPGVDDADRARIFQRGARGAEATRAEAASASSSQRA